MDYDVEAVRRHFPALDEGVAHFDGPGGSQTPDTVGDAIRRDAAGARCRTAAGRRPPSATPTTRSSQARQAMADLLGARAGRASSSAGA